jgi:type I restriction enzyme R subunit
MLNNQIHTEKSIQKNEVIELLKNMGYEYISEEENKELRNYKLKEVILKPILKEQLNKLNSYTYKGKTYKFSDKTIDKAIEDLDVPLTEGLLKSNEKIYDQLILGNSYTETLEDGSKKSFSLKYIDWEHPENNVYHFTEEFTVEKQDLTSKEKTKRPDIVLFVNGIPLAVIELKRSSVHITKGIEQIIHYQRTENIPHFFRYIQITMAGNPHSVKYATTGTEKKFWSIWREEENYEPILKELIKNRMITELDRNIYSLFNKSRLLELIYSYTLFDNNVKKIARFQQYFAIKETLKTIDEFDATGKRNGGLIWHTQGSGKSLTMVMLARALKRKIPNSKILIITDRKSLDRQINRTFHHAGFGDDVKRATSGRNFVELLKDNRGYIITAVINKFTTVLNSNFKDESRNIFVLVDESHRTQYGLLHTRMKRVLPNACYIGFTGTPLMKKEKNSFKKFGRMIHKYTMDEAVRDKAVVPLLYEGREVLQNVINEEYLDKKFELISRNLNEEQKADLKRKWTKFQKIASSEKRLEVIVLDIYEHYTSLLKGTEFNAMLATNSKFEAIRYHKLFEQYTDLKTAFVISPPDMKEGADEINEDLSTSEKNKKLVQSEWKKIIEKYSSEDAYEEKIKDKFLNGELDILIVVDKLLTGFDAPRAKVLYIDKELKDHKLLQAIARVNRIYEGKDYGVIIDYRGLLGNLDKALTSYSSLSNFDEGDVVNSVVDIRKWIADVKTYYSHLNDLFRNIKNKNDREEYEVYLADEKLRRKFYDLLKKYSKALTIALSSEKIYDVLDDPDKYKKSMKFYSDLRKSVSIRYYEKIDFGEYEDQMQKLLDTHIDANGVNHLTELVNIFDVEKFDSVIIRIEGKRAKADTIRSAVEKHIKTKWEENPIYYQTLSERIKEVLEKYHDKRISDEEYLKSMQELLSDIRKGEELYNYPNIIKNNSNAKALFDNILPLFKRELKNNNGIENIGDAKENIDYTKNIDEIVAETSLEFHKILVNNCKVDWKKNLEVHKQIKRDMTIILWKLEDKYGISLDIDKIVDTVISIALNRYGG